MDDLITIDKIKIKEQSNRYMMAFMGAGGNIILSDAWHSGFSHLSGFKKY